jgi:hypothetical protein
MAPTININNPVVPFDFNGAAVRVVAVDGETWFVAADVLGVLGLDRKALDRLDADEKGVSSIHTLGGNQEMTVINESGLYSLVLGSRKPEAKRFKRWVTAEVLPAIRKTGSYSMSGDALNDPSFSGPTTRSGALGSGGGSSGSTDFSGAFHLATGGSVTGAGTGTSDSIPAMLSNGEYVLKADTVSKIGVPLLDAINSGRAVHSAAHYATGGLVGSDVGAVSAGSAGSGSSVSVSVNAGGNIGPEDVPWLEKAIKQMIDGRLAQKMGGQGGYMWRQQTGSV